MVPFEARPGRSRPHSSPPAGQPRGRTQDPDPMTCLDSSTLGTEHANTYSSSGSPRLTLSLPADVKRCAL